MDLSRGAGLDVRFLKQATRRLLRRFGLDLVRHYREHPGNDPFLDVSRLLADVRRPTIMDVGANEGQTIAEVRAAIPDAVIHAFEPSPTTFQELERRHRGMKDIHLWNLGVAATTGSLSFLEHGHSVMSSFLAPNPRAAGRVVRVIDVPVMTLDDFTAREGIERIHALKSDTQGYDLEVFKGAERLFAEGRIDLVFYEVIVSDMYQSLPPFHDVFRFLDQRGFSLVTFYGQRYEDGMLSWTDALFAARRSVRA